MKSIYTICAEAVPMPAEAKRRIEEAPESVCDCGSCKDAREGAIKEVNKLLENHCPYYVMNVTLAMLSVVRGVMLVYNFELTKGIVEPEDKNAAIALMMATMEEFDEMKELIERDLLKHTESFIDNGEAIVAKRNGASH